MSNFKNIADLLILELSKQGIESYIWHFATTGSVYIRFKDNRIGSVRIGNHDGREKLKYKFNLRSDISRKHPKWIKDENIWRCYVHTKQWRELIDILVERNQTVKKWPESKYNYNIPYFKQKQTQ